jgi:hypothetical protein
MALLLEHQSEPIAEYSKDVVLMVLKVDLRELMEVLEVL